MDLYNLVVSAKLSKGGGGGDIDVDELSVTENGVYTASSGHAYSPVTVDVPNSYDASDEGKVVSNGALVGQTSATKTANGTYDTTLNNEVVVNVPSVTPTGNINITSTAQTDVSAYATAQVVDADLVAGNIKKDVDILGVVGTYEGGGGGSSYTLLHEEDINISTTSASAEVVKTINVPGAFTKDLLMCVATDKAGPRENYLYRTISIMSNSYAASAETYNWSSAGINNIKHKSTGWFGSNSRGVVMGDIYPNNNVDIKASYNSSGTGTIDGTFHIEIYKLKMPDGSSSPFPTV